MESSNILDYVNNTNTETEQTEYEADDDVFDFMREDLEEQFDNNDENAAEIQEKIQMQS